MSARYRLAVLNERLTSVERSLEFIEAKVCCFAKNEKAAREIDKDLDLERCFCENEKGEGAEDINKDMDGEFASI